MPLADMLTESATILKPLLRQTGAGGPDRTGPGEVLAEGVPCKVRPRGGLLAAFAALRDDQKLAVDSVRIYFAGDPLAPASALRRKHRVVVAGETYSIVSIIDPNGMGRLLQVDCERPR